MTQVLALVPATRAMTGLIKTTVGDAALALESGNLTIAIRDNGPKINGTLVVIEGSLGAVGDVFNARKEGGAPYGVHSIVGLAQYTVDAGKVALTMSADSLLDVDVDTKAPVFQVGVSA